MKRRIDEAGRFLVLLLGYSVAGVAGEVVPDDTVERIGRFLPGIEAEQIRPSPVPSLYEVSVGMNVAYVSVDGRYLFQGDVLDLKVGENLTESSRQDSRRAAMSAVDSDDMIVFAPQDVKHTITVFTDVDCPYCRKLHSDVGELNDSGIAVRYLAFPRGGVPSANYDKMVSVWCADDPRQAMSAAKAGGPVASRQCENPVAEQLRLGQRLPVRGTPTMVLEDGSVVSGYVPAPELIAIVQGSSS